jgi:site-specific DNA-methyltransferase (adenine-specific)
MQYGIKNEVQSIREGKDGVRCSLSVLNFKSSPSKGLHPTEKSKELYKWLLERYCPTGGTVLDPTAGSFNSIEVAYELGMDGIGIEMDEEFYKKALGKLCTNLIQ